MSKQERRFETILTEKSAAPNLAVVCKLIIEKLNREGAINFDRYKVSRTFADDSGDREKEEHEN